jgi:hypothetical protein
MNINVAEFVVSNVTDTCAVWNVLSSRVLYATARSAACAFTCTQFVRYECLSKPRTSTTPASEELRRRLQRALASGDFIECSIDVADLQEVEVLENRKRLGRGEISAIAFAKKSGAVAFLTDDQKARKLARVALEARRVQTTPHLLGWLVYHARLSDQEALTVISEHKELEGILAPYLHEAYMEGLRCRLMATSQHSSSDSPT